MSASSSITPGQLGAEILRQGRLFLNLIETRSNAEWDNPATPEVERALAKVMREKMEIFGWVPGQAYCIAWAGAMLDLAIERLQGAMHMPENPFYLEVISPGVMKTARAAEQRGMLSKHAEPGAIWLARWGKTGKGHAGLVEQYFKTGLTMRTIEANTSAEKGHGPNQREGDGIFAKGRDKSNNGGLVTVGFINPGAWLGMRS